MQAPKYVAFVTFCAAVKAVLGLAERVGGKRRRSRARVDESHAGTNR
jgi:hypothetical protein